MSSGDVNTTDLFEGHLRRVPSDLLPRHPVLAFITGMIYAGNPATRSAAPERFQVAAAHALDHIHELSPGEGFCHYIGREVSLRYLGRTEEAGRSAVDALTYLDSMSAADREGLGEFQAMALSILSYSLFQAGDVDRASTVAERAATAAISPWWRNYALAYVVGLHAFNGRGVEARAALALADVDSWSASYERQVPVSLGATGKAVLHLDEFDLSAAVHAYDDAEPMVAVAESWTLIAWTMMHTRLGSGEAGAEALRVEEALRAKPAPPGLGENLGTAAMRNALAILWLADGRLNKALPILRATTPFGGQLAPARLLHHLLAGDAEVAVRRIADLQAEPGHTVRSAAATDTLGAAVARRAGNEQVALRLLARAASRFECHGVRAHLMYLPADDLDGLRQLAAGAGDATCAGYLAAPVPSPIERVEMSTAQLTPRETEVLRAWARHRTRAEVAAALFVSPNTVRSQLNSAYRKLGVTTKDAAIQRAIELDVLHSGDR